jgi:hypothetical protein
MEQQQPVRKPNKKSYLPCKMWFPQDVDPSNEGTDFEPLLEEQQKVAVCNER